MKKLLVLLLLGGLVSCSSMREFDQAEKKIQKTEDRAAKTEEKLKTTRDKIINISPQTPETRSAIKELDEALVEMEKLKTDISFLHGLFDNLKKNYQKLESKMVEYRNLYYGDQALKWGIVAFFILYWAFKGYMKYGPPGQTARIAALMAQGSGYISQLRNFTPRG